jgi:uncharacterized protein with HEPN domain
VQIISEAAKELPQDMRDAEPQIPWQDIIRIGNILRHEYYRIREDILMEILTTDLPELRLAVVRLMDTERRGPKPTKPS